ncbi:MAG: hypothetical protein ACOYNN_04075 [Terrimicrobiaceae bacterium]
MSDGPEPSYWPDVAFDVDKPAWILAEELKLGLEDAEKVWAWYEKRLAHEVEWKKAEQLGRIVGLLCKPSRNITALVRSLALAAGLDELNGTHSQSEVARELKCTRSLISHYVTAWADLLDLDVFKFRKVSSSRETYRESAKASWAKRKKTHE